MLDTGHRAVVNVSVLPGYVYTKICRHYLRVVCSQFYQLSHDLSPPLRCISVQPPMLVTWSQTSQLIRPLDRQLGRRETSQCDFSDYWF